MKRSIVSMWLTLSLSALLAACGAASGQADGGSGSDGDGGPGEGADHKTTPVLTGLRLSPESLALQVGQTETITVWATWDESLEQILFEPVEWRVEPQGAVEIDDRTLLALAPGQASLRAEYGGLVSNAVEVAVEPAGPQEARGVWVTRWNYSSAADVASVIDRLASGGFNQIYFQIRGTADAYYDSAVEPWAERLSGQLGRDPGWDPLQTAIEEAHAAGIELHAWMNTYPAWSCAAGLPASEGVPHPLELHPEWVAADSNGTSMLGHCGDGYVFFSPGVPEVRAHVVAVVEDLAGRYAIDGVHLDYLRYPGIGYSHDATSEARYAEALAERPGLSWADWQREQVHALVADVYAAMRAQRPAAVLSAAIWFIHENVWGWSAVSQGYAEYYQDARAWTAAGDIDALVPMIYFPLTDPPGERLDFAAMLADHVDHNPDRFVYAGIHGDYDTFDEIAAEVEATRQLGGKGFVIFAYTYLESHAYWDDFAAGPCAEQAGVPFMPWR
ncbi:MAG: family 10 glycosylhydrolase [Deltaproteobacteria bacterium]|nr:family 10 glycosylhydrolase [Deltaproteobacteria bacterium]